MWSASSVPDIVKGQALGAGCRCGGTAEGQACEICEAPRQQRARYAGDLPVTWLGCHPRHGTCGACCAGKPQAAAACCQARAARQAIGLILLSIADTARSHVCATACVAGNSAGMSPGEETDRQMLMHAALCQNLQDPCERPFPGDMEVCHVSSVMCKDGRLWVRSDTINNRLSMARGRRRLAMLFPVLLSGTGVVTRGLLYDCWAWIATALWPFTWM